MVGSNRDFGTICCNKRGLEVFHRFDPTELPFFPSWRWQGTPIRLSLMRSRDWAGGRRQVVEAEGNSARRKSRPGHFDRAVVETAAPKRPSGRWLGGFCRSGVTSSKIAVNQKVEPRRRPASALIDRGNFVVHHRATETQRRSKSKPKNTEETEATEDGGPPRLHGSAPFKTPPSQDNAL